MIRIIINRVNRCHSTRFRSYRSSLIRQIQTSFRRTMFTTTINRRPRRAIRNSEILNNVNNFRFLITSVINGNQRRPTTMARLHRRAMRRNNCHNLTINTNSSRRISLATKITRRISYCSENHTSQILRCRYRDSYLACYIYM